MTDRCASKSCDPDKICSPATGYCVLKSGKIGQQLLASGLISRSAPRTSAKKKSLRQVILNGKAYDVSSVIPPIPTRGLGKRDAYDAARLKSFVVPHTGRALTNAEIHDIMTKAGYVHQQTVQGYVANGMSTSQAVRLAANASSTPVPKLHGTNVFTDTYTTRKKARKMSKRHQLIKDVAEDLAKIFEHFAGTRDAATLDFNKVYHLHDMVKGSETDPQILFEGIIDGVKSTFINVSGKGDAVFLKPVKTRVLEKHSMQVNSRFRKPYLSGTGSPLSPSQVREVRSMLTDIARSIRQSLRDYASRETYVNRWGEADLAQVTLVSRALKKATKHEYYKIINGIARHF